MADTPVIDLTEETTPSYDDLLYLVDDPSGSPADKKLPLSRLTGFVGLKSYPSVTAMANDSGLGTGDAAITEGTSSAGDGGAGIWVWDDAVPASTYNDDTAKVVFAYPNGKSTDGCWKKILGNVNSDVSVPVGAGERYTTISAALQHLGSLQTVNGADIVIELQTGFTMEEQIIVANGTDYSHVKITSVDAQVTIDRSTITAFTTSLDGFQGIGTHAAAFMAGNNAALPRIGTVFAFDASGSADYRKSGIFITNGSKCIVEENCGIHDTDGSGAYVRYSSALIAPGSTWDNNGTDEASAGNNELCGIRCEFQCILSAQEATVTNSNEMGIQVLGASVASLRDATITGAASIGIYGGGCSVIHARGVTVTGCNTGMYAYEGCIVRLIQTDLSSNTSNGLWIESNAVVNSATGTTINNNGANGVRISSGGRFSITTPTITGNTGDGINVSSGEVFISGGEISGSGDNDIEIGGAHAIVRLSGTVTTTSGNTADNNVTDSNVSAFNLLERDGTGGIFGRGGDVSNRGTATVASGTTSIAVTHGVDFTPLLQEVSVTPTNNPTNAVNYWISNMTSTQFTINTNTDPGSGGASFAWNLHRVIG